jgi:hypothetical protein
MILEEFDNLKIGDEIYLPDEYKEGKFMSTEVLEINKEEKKIKAFMDSDKFRDYTYIQKSIPFEKVSCSVGIVGSPRSDMWKMFAILSSDAINKL